MENTFKIIEKQISENPIILYMKGSPNFPNCGFSSKAAKILSLCTKDYAYINVLLHEKIRVALPKFSNWPTFPQLWINKNLIGGSDIITDMYHNGTLQDLINQTKIKNNNNKI